MGIINKIIGESAFEKIRDRIYEIVSDELLQQAAITYDDDFLDATVYLERWVPFQHAEMPCVNITFAGGDIDGTNHETKNSSHREYRFNIDFYGHSPTTSSDRGDKRAAIRVQRLMAVVDAIMRDKRYTTLQFERPFIMNTKIESINIGNPQNTMDAANVVLGRLIFVVRVPEDVQDVEPRDLPGYTTNVLIGDSSSGYVFSGDNVPIIEPACDPVAVIVNDQTLATVDSGGTFSMQVVNTVGLPVGTWNYYTEQWIVPADVVDSYDLSINGTLFLANQSGDLDIDVQNTNDDPVGSDDGGVYRIDDADLYVNNTLIDLKAPAEGSRNIPVVDDGGSAVGSYDSYTNQWVVPSGSTDVLFVRDFFQAGDQETAVVGSMGWYKANTTIFDDTQPAQGIGAKLDPDDDTQLLTLNRFGNYDRVTNDRGGQFYVDVGGGLTADGASANVIVDNYTGTVVYRESLHAGTQHWDDSVVTAQGFSAPRYDGSTYNQWQMLTPKLVQHYLTGDGQDSHIFIGIENWADSFHWIMGLSVGGSACYFWRENQPWNATNLFNSFSRTSVNSGIDLIVWANIDDYV